jgi:hypothetical protein
MWDAAMPDNVPYMVIHVRFSQDVLRTCALRLPVADQVFRYACLHGLLADQPYTIQEDTTAHAFHVQQYVRKQERDPAAWAPSRIGWAQWVVAAPADEDIPYG